MAVPDHRARIDALREAVRRAVDERRIRNVAAEVGMSIGGLHGFLQGSEPRGRTRDKLLDWHARTTTGTMPPEVAWGHLERLMEGLSGRMRERALERMLAVVREAHRRQGTPPPGWVAVLAPEAEDEA